MDEEHTYADVVRITGHAFNLIASLRGRLPDTIPNKAAFLMGVAHSDLEAILKILIATQTKN